MNQQPMPSTFDPFDPQSVCALGPSDIGCAVDWNGETANCIAHFLELARYLAQSSWIRSGVSYTFFLRGPVPRDFGGPACSAPNASGPFNFERPDLYALNAVLVLIRQLHGEDKLFKQAYNRYEIHGANQWKKFCVRHHHAQFFKAMEETQKPLGCDETGHRLLELFQYQFGLLHSPKHDQVRAFRDMVHRYGKERAFMAFHMVLRQLPGHALAVAQVIEQDFSHWINVERCIGPDRVTFADILEAGRSASPPEPKELGDSLVTFSIPGIGQ